MKIGIQRKILSVLLMLICGLLVAFNTLKIAPIEVNLKDAIAQNLIKASFNSNGNFNGLSVHFDILNTSKSSLSIIVPAGTTFVPENDEEQTLIVLENEVIAIAPHAKIDEVLDGYCINLSKHCPTESKPFKLSETKNENFKKLFSFVGSKKINPLISQSVAWAISDNQPVSSIEGDDSATKELKKFMFGLLNQKETWYTSSPNYVVTPQRTIAVSTVAISGYLDFTLTKNAVVHQEVTNSEGKIMMRTTKDFALGKGNVKSKFSLKVTGWQKGKYFVKIKDALNVYATFEFNV